MLATFKKFMFALSGSSIMQLATLACALIVSNMFGPVGLSKFGIVQNTITTISSVLPFGLGYTAINFINTNRQNGFGPAVADFALQTCLIISLFSAVLLLILAEPFTLKFYSDDSLSVYIVLAAIGLPFATVSLVQHSLLNGFEAYAELARSAFMSAVFTVSFVIAGAWISGLQGAIYGFLFALFARASLLQCLLVKQFPCRWALPSVDVWNKIKHFAIPTGLAGLTLTPSVWYANTLLIKYEGLETQGVMMAALTIRMAISFIPQQMSSVLLPQYIQAGQEDIKVHIIRIGRYIIIMTGLTVVLCITAYIMRDILISAFGNDFHIDQNVMMLLMLSLVFEATATPFSHVHAKYQTMWRFMLIYSYPKDFIFVFCSFIWVPSHGTTGMAFAYIASNLAGLALVSCSAFGLLFKNNAKTR